MLTWTQEQQLQFFKVFADLWPTSIFARDNSRSAESARLWVDNLSAFELTIAVEALRKTKEEEKTTAPPTIQRVRSEAMSIHGRRTVCPRYNPSEPLLTAQEFAESPWWCSRLARATATERARLMEIRSRLRNGDVRRALRDSVLRTREPGDDG